MVIDELDLRILRGSMLRTVVTYEACRTQQRNLTASFV